MNKKLRYFLEAIFAYFLYVIFLILPYKWASNLGGWLGRTIGGRLAASRKAIKNLQMAFPDLDQEQAHSLTVDMWENLARIMAEYPHLSKLERDGHLEIENLETLTKAEATGRPILFMTAHLGNWEVLPFFLNTHLKNPLALVYRAPNNPWVNKLLQRLRGAGTKDQLPKGKQGAKDIIRLLKNGQNVGMLVDQKMNEGIPVPFFGKHAMTVTSVAQLALKYDCLILPIYCQRLDEKTRFKIIIEDEMKPVKTGQLTKDIEATMRLVNEKMENWIKQKPAQWLWIHRRWPRNKNKK